MAFTEKDVLDALKSEWKNVERITNKRPEYCEDFVSQFAAITKFAEKLTGRKYTVTEEDGVIEY